MLFKNKNNQTITIVNSPKLINQYSNDPDWIIADEEEERKYIEKERIISEKHNQIQQYLIQLQNTDYIDFKHYEHQILEEEWLKYCQIRQNWRDQINILEQEIIELESSI